MIRQGDEIVPFKICNYFPIKAGLDRDVGTVGLFGRFWAVDGVSFLFHAKGRAGSLNGFNSVWRHRQSTLI